MNLNQPLGTPSNPLALCAAADDRYAEGLAMTLLTALWSLPDATSCELVLLDAGLSNETKESLKKEINELARKKSHPLTWTWKLIDLSSFQHLPPLRGDNYATYARLFLAEELSLHSILWLDCDLLVFRDLLNLSDEITGDPLIAGCQDTGVKIVANDTPVPALSKSDLPYLNAGFLWLNLHRMRKDHFSENLRSFITHYQDDLRFHDQTALNSFVGNARQVLPPSYNYLCAPWYRDNSALLENFPSHNLHYLGGDKPWMTSQRLSCYTRNLVYHHTRHRLLGVSVSEGLTRTRSLISLKSLPQNLLGLFRQLILRENEGTEDRFQSLRELRAAYSGKYETEILKRLDQWFHLSRPSHQKAHTKQPILI